MPPTNCSQPGDREYQCQLLGHPQPRHDFPTPTISTPHRPVVLSAPCFRLSSSTCPRHPRSSTTTTPATNRSEPGHQAHVSHSFGCPHARNGYPVPTIPIPHHPIASSTRRPRLSTKTRCRQQRITQQPPSHTPIEPFTARAPSTNKPISWTSTFEGCLRNADSTTSAPTKDDTNIISSPVAGGMPYVTHHHSAKSLNHPHEPFGARMRSASKPNTWISSRQG